jgi:hypothetical protein
VCCLIGAVKWKHVVRVIWWEMCKVQWRLSSILLLSRKKTRQYRVCICLTYEFKTTNCKEGMVLLQKKKRKKKALVKNGFSYFCFTRKLYSSAPPLVILAAKYVIAIVSSTPSSILKGEYRHAYVTIYGLGPSVQPKK